MNFFNNPIQRGSRGLSCTTNSTCNCNGNCGCSQVTTPTQVLGTTTEVEVLAARPVQAMLQSVIDSCCQTDDVTQEISLPCPGIFNCQDLEIGTILDVELDGDITFREVKRDKEDCNCLSSVRFQIPIKLSPIDDCSCPSVSRVITVIRTVDLCCTKDSMLLAANSKVLSANAWVTDIYPDHVKIYISLSFRSCLQQTIMQIYEFNATPVCTYPNCNEIRNSFVDSCDLTCGCTAGAKTCPSC